MLGWWPPQTPSAFRRRHAPRKKKARRSVRLRQDLRCGAGQRGPAAILDLGLGAAARADRVRGLGLDPGAAHIGRLDLEVGVHRVVQR